MLDTIIDLLNKTGKGKIEFKPEIKIMMEPFTHPVWIDSIYKIREMFMVKISTEKDAINKPLNQLNDHQLIILNNRLQNLTAKK